MADTRSAIASAREGLSEAELAGLLAQNLPKLPPDVCNGELQVVLRQVRPYLMRKAHAQGIVHAEVFFDPQTHSARGIELSTVLDGLCRARAEAERELGITCSFILCFLRHLSADEAMRTLEDALPHKDAIAAVGLDSSELGHPPAKFSEVFARARREGRPR